MTIPGNRNGSSGLLAEKPGSDNIGSTEQFIRPTAAQATDMFIGESFIGVDE